MFPGRSSLKLQDSCRNHDETCTFFVQILSSMSSDFPFSLLEDMFEEDETMDDLYSVVVEYRNGSDSADGDENLED
jgi:hypothetical protein